jgi:type IV pilus assembly protein PilN
MGQSALIRFVQAFESSDRFGINFQQASLDQNSGLYNFGATIGLIASTQTAQTPNTPGGAQNGSPSR